MKDQILRVAIVLLAVLALVQNVILWKLYGELDEMHNNVLSHQSQMSMTLYEIREDVNQLRFKRD